jgi:hypothetical protein
MNARQINYRAVDYLRQIAERKNQLVADGDEATTSVMIQEVVFSIIMINNLIHLRISPLDDR